MDVWSHRYKRRNKAGKITVKIHNRERKGGFVSHFSLLFTQLKNLQRDWSVTFQLYNASEDDCDNGFLPDIMLSKQQQQQKEQFAYKQTFQIYYAFSTTSQLDESTGHTKSYIQAFKRDRK